MTATIEFTHADGPLISAGGEFLLPAAPAPVAEPAVAPLEAAITVRCIDHAGRDLATPITIRPDQPLNIAALRLVIRDRKHGQVTADRFGRATFNALQELDERDHLTGRDRAIQKRLQMLDHLAVIGYEHNATITWTTEGD